MATVLELEGGESRFYIPVDESVKSLLRTPLWEILGIMTKCVEKASCITTDMPPPAHLQLD